MRRNEPASMEIEGRCRHCGKHLEITDAVRTAPTHDYPPGCRAVCPGAGQPMLRIDGPEKSVVDIDPSARKTITWTERNPVTPDPCPPPTMPKQQTPRLRIGFRNEDGKTFGGFDRNGEPMWSADGGILKIWSVDGAPGVLNLLSRYPFLAKAIVVVYDVKESGTFTLNLTLEKND